MLLYLKFYKWKFFKIYDKNIFTFLKIFYFFKFKNDKKLNILIIKIHFDFLNLNELILFFSKNI